MSEKRRDNRGRILHNGESQRQDGRYAYKYKDLNGEYKFVYSWRLDKNDRTHAGRARDLSLREKERQIQQDLFKKIVPNGGDLTVLDLVEKYLSLKVNVRHNTQANYNFVLNIIRKEDFGKLRIDKVKQSDAKAWLIKMQKVDGRGYSSIHKKKRIRVDHQLQRAHTMEYIIEDTKTKNGERFVPMSPEVMACFRRIIANRKKPAKEPMVDGYTGFLFLDKNEMPMVALHWEHYFKHIRTKYNKIYRIQLPKITPHVCRHTFCSNMAKSGMNPKTLQYIMGHSDIGITLDTYTHLKIEDAQEEFDRVMEA